MWFPLSRHRVHFNSRCEQDHKGTERTISWWSDTHRDKPCLVSLLHRCWLHPIILMAFIHCTDVIKKTNYHKLVIYHPHEVCHPHPGTSLDITICVSPLPSHTALSVCQLSTSYGWSQLYISHSHTQSDSHTVGHLWERLVRVIKAQCSTHRQSEGKRRTIQCD